MGSVAVTVGALAVIVFFAYHAVIKIMEHKEKESLNEELKKVKIELEDEILHCGNVARIAQLRERMFLLERMVYGE